MVKSSSGLVTLHVTFLCHLLRNNKKHSFKVFSEKEAELKTMENNSQEDQGIPSQPEQSYNNYSNKHNNHNNHNYNHNNHNHNHNYNHNYNHNHNHNKRGYPSIFKKNRNNSAEFSFYPDTPCQLIDFLGGVHYSPEQDNGVIFNRVVSFFQNILTTIEKEKKMEHFRMTINQKYSGFFVKIIEVDKGPPSKVLNCISCDLESETSKVSKLDYPSTTKERLHNLWMDAKARPMFVITPIRHVERLSECTEEEIFSLFLLSVQALEEEQRISGKKGMINFICMTLNHGNSRNLAHLHLKIRLPRHDFKYFMNNGWDKAKKEKYAILESGLYKRDERIRKIK
ncbi:hypothetical protein Glove_519g74 [Diversispora epigaea]|uniref:HIT domain-containing protein n=1 Tax=Diversispora epigaea TaxID=1348612 RepID=A0A397GGL3_9GLOM|nr:hypothetical protein Glove_519g74 [Diversispora epigaea]